MALEVEQQIRQTAAQIRLTIQPFGRGAIRLSDGRVVEMNGLLTADGTQCRWRAFNSAMGHQWEYANPIPGSPSWAPVTLVPYPDAEVPLQVAWWQRLEKNTFLRDAIFMAIDNWCTEEAKPASMGYSIQDPNRHIKWLERIINRFGLRFSATELLEQIPAIRSVDLNTMYLMSRVLTQFPGSPTEDMSLEVVKVLVESPIEDVLIAYRESDLNRDRVADFIEKVLEVQGRGLSAEQKIQTVQELEGLKRFKRWYQLNTPQH